jgi:hypothetical protein
MPSQASTPEQQGPLAGSLNGQGWRDKMIQIKALMAERSGHLHRYSAHRWPRLLGLANPP